MALKPNFEEFLTRIPRHLEHRNNSNTINLIWHGYLAALMEWGFLQPDEYSQLQTLLKDVGRDEIQEVFLGLDGPNP